MDYSGIDNARFMIRHGSSNGLSQSNSGFAVTGMIRIPEVYTEKNEKSKQQQIGPTSSLSYCPPVTSPVD